MAELREILARNLYELRSAAGLTQLTFAEKMNYSDKAVSKWERAESAPDIFMLKKIADFFDVTVDYLLTSEHKSDELPEKISEKKKRQRAFISAISVVGVWLVAVAYFVIHLTFLPSATLPGWMAFIYAIPTSATVALVLNSLWGRRRIRFFIISVMVWSVILSIHLTLLTVLPFNLWALYLVGVPAEIIILLVAGLAGKKKNKKGGA